MVSSQVSMMGKICKCAQAHLAASTVSDLTLPMSYTQDQTTDCRLFPKVNNLAEGLS